MLWSVSEPDSSVSVLSVSEAEELSTESVASVTKSILVNSMYVQYNITSRRSLTLTGTGSLLKYPMLVQRGLIYYNDII